MIGFRVLDTEPDSNKDGTDKEKTKSVPGIEIPSSEPSVVPTPAPDRIENKPELEIPSRPVEISSPGMSPEISSTNITEM
ncbi:hypothetical protein acsn021_44070 [Anaerocolumna cellulosilytica]|uniref:Uncharacterized protein n=1 Tax=Anaerocolumna cellulosilytica TaxID=433286 RepID=A0A6S6RDF1_9FIRM|nr:hypothetical protein [Anaerocolumna cellulosilytica]MBB5195828.1 hypothetical protein [Anaerocolumna cellulosilytica]BCJ96838.1 hypothetical protein acsn021_44070 [Anaerocolumna cellulosilytica]